MRPRYRFEFPSLLHERLMGVSLRGDFCKVCPVTDRMRMGCNFSFSGPMLFPSSLFLLSFLFFFFFFFLSYLFILKIYLAAPGLS